MHIFKVNPTLFKWVNITDIIWGNMNEIDVMQNTKLDNYNSTKSIYDK